MILVYISIKRLSWRHRHNTDQQIGGELGEDIPQQIPEMVCEL